MNAKEQMKVCVGDEMTAHFAKQRVRAKYNARNKKRGRLNDRLDDDIERRTRLDDVVRDCDFNPESTSFRIS